jgi:hypothetical protein
MNDARKDELEQLLEQAAAFARGGDYTGAFARARWAYEQIQLSSDRRGHADAAVEELLRSAEHKLAEYKHLVREWQDENARRHAAYMSRELRAIQTFGGEEPSPVPLGVEARRGRLLITR